MWMVVEDEGILKINFPRVSPLLRFYLTVVLLNDGKYHELWMVADWRLGNRGRRRSDGCRVFKLNVIDENVIEFNDIKWVPWERLPPPPPPCLRRNLTAAAPANDDMDGCSCRIYTVRGIPFKRADMSIVINRSRIV